MAARTVRIHLPWTATIVPLMLFVCSTPLATAGGAWIVLYAVPVAALLAVLLAGTTATASGLSARWLRGVTRVPWEQLHQIELPGARWAVAVTTSGRRVVLPGVRPADLPRIVAAAGGRLFVQRPVRDRAGAGTDAEPAEEASATHGEAQEAGAGERADAEVAAPADLGQ